MTLTHPAAYRASSLSLTYPAVAHQLLTLATPPSIALAQVVSNILSTTCANFLFDRF